MPLSSTIRVWFVFAIAATAAYAQVSVSTRVLVPNGGRLSWYKGPNSAHELIAFDAVPTAGQFRSEVFTIASNSSGLRCVTCGSIIPQGFVGQPAWHSNGESMILQAESPNSAHGYYNSVLWGFDNDLWMIRRDGTGAERVWATPAGWAALHPQFSQDGTKLMFAERTPVADAPFNPSDNWRIRIADFDINQSGTRKLSNIRTVQPNGSGFYETHEFAVGDRMVYSFIPSGGGVTAEIYSAYLNGLSATNLTGSTNSWNEHGHLSPANPYAIAFMSNRFDSSATPSLFRTELYLGRLGGSFQRITYFNQSPTDNYVVKDMDWNRAGNQVAFLVSGPKFPASQIWIASFQ